MPTYDYVCDACGHELEIFQSMTEAPKRKCPACGKQKLSRRIGGGAAVLFRGSGFYQTDYRSDSYKKAAEKASGGESGGAKEDAPKKEKESAGSGSSAAKKEAAPKKGDSKPAGGAS